MRFFLCFRQSSLCTVPRVLTVRSDSAVVFERFHIFQLQLCCTATEPSSCGCCGSKDRVCESEDHIMVAERFGS